MKTAAQWIGAALGGRWTQVAHSATCYLPKEAAK
jgi:hypothetical protein